MRTRLSYRRQRRKNYKAKFSIIKTSRDEIFLKTNQSRKRLKKVAIKIIRSNLV
jgi:hypothetical protein